MNGKAYTALAALLVLIAASNIQASPIAKAHASKASRGTSLGREETSILRTPVPGDTFSPQVRRTLADGSPAELLFLVGSCHHSDSSNYTFCLPFFFWKPMR